MSSPDEIVDRVLWAGRRLSTAEIMFHTAVAERAGLSTTESKALEIIDRLGPLTPGDLARESGLAPASVTALLDRLARKGVARRVAHPGDKRRVLVEVEPSHVEANNEIFADFTAALREMCAGYSPRELEVVERFLADAAECQHQAAVRLSG